MVFDPLAYLWYLIAAGSPGLVILGSIFWAFVLIDCVVKEPAEAQDKVAWLILIIFVPVLGALLYYLVRRPERVKAYGR